MALDILIVDDEEDIRDLVAGVLEDEGFTTRTAANSDSAIDALDTRRPSLVLLDVWLQGSRMDGLELLEEIKRRDPTVPVLMISGHGNIDTAVAAIRKGAADFIEKPFEADRLLHLVARATETERLRRENQVLRARFGQDDELTGTSAAINGVRATIKKVAGTGSRVLISGPAGVGKEVAALLVATIAASSPPPAWTRTGSKRNCSALRIRAASSAPASWNNRMAAPSISTRSPTCRSPPRARSCAC